MPEFITPALGAITFPYGAADPYTGGLHSGVDIGVPDRTSIHASNEGVVTHAGLWGVGGNTIKIRDAQGFETVYEHLSSLLVHKGAQVTQGQAIGLSGGRPGEAGAGNSTGAHLHFEIDNPSGKPINPDTVMSLTPAITNASPPQMSAAPKVPGSLWSQFVDGITHPLGLGVAKDVVGGAVDTVSATVKISEFISAPGNWKRIGQGAAGVVILVIVGNKLLSTSPTYNAAKSAALKGAIA
jgi:hypothetical protein